MKMKMNMERLFLNHDEIRNLSVNAEDIAKWLWPQDQEKQASFCQAVAEEIKSRLEIQEE